MSRFQRLEAGMRFANVDDAILRINEPYNPATGFATRDAFMETDHRAGVTYVQPNLALVFDNSLFGYVGPFYGQRYRVEVAPTLGSWNFTQVTADYRRYDRLLGPIVLASRLLYFGRVGTDAQEFRIYAGSNDMIRGNTSGSYRRNECRQEDPGTETGCVELDRLVGTQIGVASVELRFPILNPSFGISGAFPPLEGAIFYDMGLVWDDNTTIRWKRRVGDSPTSVRTPLKTVGFALRTNLFGFAIARLDYSVPQDRPSVGGLWTFSLGPTF
jgi:outer membrane protein assembly factor BamA